MGFSEEVLFFIFHIQYRKNTDGDTFMNDFSSESQYLKILFCNTQHMNGSKLLVME